MTVLRDFRRIADALEKLTATHKRVLGLAEAQRPSEERLDALELERHRFEAEMEGLLLKAEGKLKAAANSEARERHQRERHEANADPFADESEELERQLQDRDAEAGATEGMHVLSVGLEKNSKAYALRAKWS